MDIIIEDLSPDISIDVTPTITVSTIEMAVGSGPQGPAGTGPKGADGTDGTDGIDGPQWFSAWAATATYAKNSMVSYDGSSYIALQDVPQGLNPTNVAYWDLVASKASPAPTWKGLWDETLDYPVNSLVSYEKNVYISTHACARGILPTNASYWTLFVEKGADGISWKGLWVPVLTYVKDDVVFYKGSSFIAIRYVPLNISPPNTYYWNIMTLRGDVEYASIAEAIQGTTTDKVITPYTLKNVISFTYHQPSPASEWIIVHGLGRYPNITVIDSAGTEVEGEKTYIDINTIKVLFKGGFSGTAYLN